MGPPLIQKPLVRTGEMPAGWDHPYFPMRAQGANSTHPWGSGLPSPSAAASLGMAFRLQQGLVSWAFELTQVR